MWLKRGIRTLTYGGRYLSCLWFALLIAIRRCGFKTNSRCLTNSIYNTKFVADILGVSFCKTTAYARWQGYNMVCSTVAANRQ